MKIDQTYQSVYQTKPVEKVPSIWEKNIQFGKAFPLKERQKLYQMLGILLRSGLGIMDCLAVLIEQASSKKIKAMLEQLQSHLEDGLPLSQAITHQPHFFSEFEIQNLKAGEESGQMADILTNLAALYGKRLRLKRKIIQAFSYPVAVIVVALLVLTFMIAFVVPMFEDIFQRFDSKLPPITEWLLSLSDFVQENGLWMILGLILSSVAAFFLQRQAGVRRVSAKVLLRLPLLGNLIRKLQLSRLAYTFSILLSAKVNLDQTLTLLTEIIRFPPLKSALVQIRKEVIEGSSLYDAISQQDIFPLYFRQIIRVGEQTARLDQMMEQMALSLEEESEAGVQQLTQFLEPLLIIVLGIMVAVILVAMYLPMFELSNAIG
ncbi:MAG: type II secretion system F family protein [Bacteroidota bacterium]